MAPSSSGLAPAASFLAYALVKGLLSARTGCPVERPVARVEVSPALSTSSLYCSDTVHSFATRKRVPTWTPAAPSIKAAATPRPSAIPPAATTGTSTASTTCGTSAIVDVSPICPPDSVPSATTAVAPRRATRRASATEATTGMTLMPASFQAFMYLVGLPAPVTTTGTCSSITTCATWSANGLISMTFTPKGLSVLVRSS